MVSFASVKDSAEDQNLRRSGAHQRRRLIYLKRDLAKQPTEACGRWLRHKRQRRAGVARPVPWVDGRELSKGRANNQIGPPDVTRRNIREGELPLCLCHPS